MFNKLKEVVEISLNALAPPPPLLEDFVYNWKKFLLHFYRNVSCEAKNDVENTNLPWSLERLREILVREDQEVNDNDAEIGPCMEYILKRNVLGTLVSIAIFDDPAGMKPCILRFFSKTLTQIKEPNIAHSAIYTPLMKLMNVCDGLLHSVSEIEEIEFLLHLCAVIRKQPAVAIMFFSDESAEYLTEVTDQGDSIKYKNVLDLTLSYVDSADMNVRIMACQCILLLCSTDDDEIAKLIIDNFKFNHFLIGRLTTLFYEIPPGTSDQIKKITATWTLDATLNKDTVTINNHHAIAFFCWLDFINQLSLESHDSIKDFLRQCVTNNFLKEAFNISFLSSPETMSIFYKYYCCITSPVLISGFQEWLLTFGDDGDVLEITISNPILRTVIDNCSSEDMNLAVICLEFFDEVLSKVDEKILNSLVLCYLKDRLYYDTNVAAASWSDEEDERLKYSSSPELVSCSRTLAPSSIDKIIQSFVNIMPPQVRVLDSEKNVEKLRNQFEQILDRCSLFNWPKEAISDVECISNDSNPEVDSHNKSFYEGPFLRMIFSKIREMPRLPFTQTSILISIISKLAILPHPFVHEYLMNPSLPLRKNVQSLYSALHYVVLEVSSRVQVILDYQNELKVTWQELKTEESEKDHVRKRNEIDRYLETCILLEELCNHLATIAYVKYTYFH